MQFLSVNHANLRHLGWVCDRYNPEEFCSSRGNEALTEFMIYDLRFTSHSTIPAHRVNRIS
jgi:hypothetical protein